jgi:hypothetical protein
VPLLTRCPRCQTAYRLGEGTLGKQIRCRSCGCLSSIQRWNLLSGEREVTAPLPFQGVVKALALGSASQGPLLVHWAVGTGALDNAPISFLDLKTLKELPLKGATGGTAMAESCSSLRGA